MPLTSWKEKENVRFSRNNDENHGLLKCVAEVLFDGRHNSRKRYTFTRSFYMSLLENELTDCKTVQYELSVIATQEYKIFLSTYAKWR